MTERTYRGAIAAILVLLAAAALWNAHRLSPDLGYDAESHQRYAEVLFEERRIPGLDEPRAAWSKPPGFYAVAGAAGALGERLGLADPHKAVQYLNALLVVAAALLALVFVRELWPDRPGTHVAALAFLALVPVTVRSAGMYYAGALALLLCTVALALAARMLARRDFRPRWALALGALLVAATLVMLHALWVYAAVVASLALAALALPAHRRRALTAAALVASVALLAASPWFARQATAYGDPLAGYRLALSGPVGGAGAVLSLRLPELAAEPYRPSFVGVVPPTAYAELWGDYFGVFAWNSAVDETPRPAVAAALRAQMAVGILPTALAVAGWLALLGLSVRRGAVAAHPERLLVALLPALGLAGFLYYVLLAGTTDGDTIKATYLLTVAPAWAAAFAFALDGLAAGRAGKALLGLLLVAAAVDYAFLVVPW